VETDMPPAAVAAGGEAQSSGAGSSSQQDTADGGATPATGPVLPGTTSAAAATPVAPVGDTDGATGASAAQPVGSQVARQVAVLRGGPDGAHTMTLVLTPDNLGPVEVQVTLQQGTVDLTLRGAHEHGRAALLDALPDLRRDLEAAGLTPSRLEVDRDTGGAFTAPQQNPGERRGQQDWTSGPVRPWSRAADTEESRPVPRPVHRSPERGLDLRV
jgi:flagellar hook-length control protein FliK